MVTVTASHARDKYVVVEDFDSLLSSFTCSEQTNTLSLSFGHVESFEAAKSLWSHDKHLLFVTHHWSCNSDFERGVHKYVSRLARRDSN